MYVIDGIAYAGEMPNPVRVRSVRALEDYRLFVTFDTGERRIFDFKPLLDMPCYRPLKDVDVFKGVYIDLGTAVWNDDIDIAPETLYYKGVPVASEEIA